MKRANAVKVVGGVVVIVVLVWSLGYREQMHTRTSLEMQLSNEPAVTVEIAGKQYVVRHGVIEPQPETLSAELEVLQLAWYGVLSERHSPFMLPGVELGELEARQQALVSSAHYMQQLYEGVADVRELYPTEFFKARSELEEQRRVMVASVSRENIAAYQQALIATFDALDSYLTTTIEQLTLAATPTQELAFWGGVSDVATISTQLEVMREEVVALRQQSVTRLACTEQFTSDCEMLVSLDRWQLPVVDDSVVNDVDPSTVIDQQAFLTAYLHASSSVPEEPVVALHNRDCSPDGQTPLYGVFKASYNDVSYTHVALVNDLYFHNTKTSRAPFLQFLAESGIEYERQLLNPYICLYAPETVQKVRGVLAVRDAAAVFVLPEQTSAVMAAAAEAQRALLEAPVVTEVLVLKYISSLQRAYTELSGEDQEIVHRQLQTVLSNYFDGVVGLGDMLAWMARANATVVAINNVTGETMVEDLYRFMVLRGYFSGTLLTFSQTFTGTQFHWYNEEKPTPDFAQYNLLSYVRDLSPDVSWQELLRQTEQSNQRVDTFNTQYISH